MGVFSQSTDLRVAAEYEYPELRDGSPRDWRRGKRAMARAANGEQRISQLAFIAPPIGAHINAVQELTAVGSPEQAMYHSTVWACTDLIASMMGMLQPWAFKIPGAGVKTPTPGPGIGMAAGSSQKLPSQPQILNEPAAGLDIGDWLYAATVALIRGNVYGSIAATDRLGYPSQIELQDNNRVLVARERDGSVTYKFGGQVQDPSTVWHRTIFRPAGHVTGMSLLQYSQRAVRLGLDAEDFASGFFEEGAHPSGLLTNDSQAQMSQSDASTVKQKFMAALHGGREPVVMTGGWKFQPVQVSPSDSQFLPTEQQVDLKVCRYFRVPPEIVAVAMQSGSITYANVEQRGLDFLSYCLQRWITWWERKLGQCLPGGQYVKFDLSPILRTDILTRWLVNHAQIASRVMTQDEVRQGEDLPPLTDAQREQVNAMPLQPMLPKLSQGL